MKIAAVVAVATNNVIGVENDLPWRLSNDLKWFKKNTMNKPMIMGRKTFQSLPGVLPGRTSIILTRDPAFEAPGALIATTIEQALELATQDAASRNTDEISVVGGGEIYKLFMPLLSRLYLTRVHTTIDGDTLFPELDPADWKTTFEEHHEASEKDDFPYSFYILDREQGASE
ncbi:dihydrofolate reductase [Sneathiella chinensis]|uniref:Dihydrofolate reductase n=1 Tax=Sneathiella chinensis TaxID=349750 RepID=A0ABQ5U2C2_9PROT|nr:dihydrofolate reductase [Sneathiella chinensis]GLQ05810.1 dihydrofolate reductase [Sneathiella chinensis]